MTLWLSYWWCDHCAVAVDSEHATIAATHSLASGGCGKRLTERFNSTEPPERDALAAENARLREAFGLLADYVGCYRAVIEVYTLPHVADESEASRLRELIAEMDNDEVEARTALGQYEEAARSLVDAPR